MWVVFAKKKFIVQMSRIDNASPNTEHVGTTAVADVFRVFFNGIDHESPPSLFRISS